MHLLYESATTRWTADDAYCVIEFLDELRDVLWVSYGDQIIEMQQQATAQSPPSDEYPPDDVF